MTTPVPASDGGNDRRAMLGVALVVLLLLASCGAYALGRAGSGGDATAAPSPSGSAAPVPGPTVTITATPSPAESLPSTGGNGGNGGNGGTGGNGGGQLPSTGSGDGSGSGTVDGGGARDFTMSAALGGAPVLIGERRDLAVTVRNPNASALQLVEVRVAPRTPSAPGCLASWVSVSSYDASRDGAVRVPARGTATVTLTFELVDLATTNQNACQGATFPLALSGSGRLA